MGDRIANLFQNVCTFCASQFWFVFKNFSLKSVKFWIFFYFIKFKKLQSFSYVQHKNSSRQTQCQNDFWNQNITACDIANFWCTLVSSYWIVKTCSWVIFHCLICFYCSIKIIKKQNFLCQFVLFYHKTLSKTCLSHSYIYYNIKFLSLQ